VIFKIVPLDTTTSKPPHQNHHIKTTTSNKTTTDLAKPSAILQDNPIGLSGVYEIVSAHSSLALTTNL